MKFYKISFLVLATLFTFSSCDKGYLTKGEEDFKKEDKEEDKESCFELVYPVNYTMPDGSTVITQNDEKDWDAIKEWYDNNPNFEKDKMTIAYPVDVVFKDESSKTIDNEDDMILLKKDCYGIKESKTIINEH